MDDKGSFVVHLIGSDDPKPFKHFGMYPHAAAYGRPIVQAGEAERADIYFVLDESNPAAAVAAVKLGRAKLLHSQSHHASEAQIESHKERALNEALKAGPEAFLKFLRLS
jgi:hypothetical protein